MNNNQRTNNQVVVYRKDGRIIKINNRCPQKYYGPQGQDDIIDAEWCLVERNKKKCKGKYHKNKKRRRNDWAMQAPTQFIPVRVESALDRFCNDLVDNGQLNISIDKNGTQIRYNHKSGFNIGFNL